MQQEIRVNLLKGQDHHGMAIPNMVADPHLQWMNLEFEDLQREDLSWIA